MGDQNDDQWLPLRDAAELLGAHPSTVRQWSDLGMLPALRTPGGHRRFRRGDVRLFAGTQQKPRPVATDHILDEALRGIRLQITEGRLAKEAWYQKLDDEARNQYRASAHWFFNSLLGYMRGDEAVEASEAHAIGYEYASRARRYQLSYVDAARAFLFFRDALIEAVVKVGERARLPAGELGTLFHKVHKFTDAILIALLETYRKLEGANR